MVTNFLHGLGQFFLTQWLWSITWGWYHALFAALFMTLLLRFFARKKLLASFALAAGSQLWSFVLYSLFVVGVLIVAFDLQYAPESFESVAQETNFFVVAFNLGLIYSVLQLFFFMIVKHWYRFSVRLTFLLSIISNVLAAWVVYVLLPLQL